MTTATRETINLLPFDLTDGGIQFEQLERVIDPPSQLAVVFYNDNNQPQELGLRLDLGKMAFLDVDPFIARWGATEGRERASRLARELVHQLATSPKLRTKTASS